MANILNYNNIFSIRHYKDGEIHNSTDTVQRNANPTIINYNNVFSVRHVNGDPLSTYINTEPREVYTINNITVTSEQVNLSGLTLFGTKHPRDYYRGKSFHYAGRWEAGNHYINDTYKLDFVTRHGVLLACRKGHLSTVDNAPDDFVYNEYGEKVGINSEYWDFILAGVKTEIITDENGVIYIDGFPLDDKVLSDQNFTLAEKEKLAGIEAGAEVNVLEGVQVNGSDLPIVNKKVNVEVPTALSQLADDSTHRLVTDEEKALWTDGGGAYHVPEGGIPASDLAPGVIPDVSQFITNTTNNLVNYYRKSQTYTKSEILNLLDSVAQFTYEVVEELPDPPSEFTLRKIYLVPSSNPSTGNIKDEYITIQSNNGYEDIYSWEQIGSTSISLDGYITTNDLNAALANYTTTTDLTSLLSEKQDNLISGLNIKNFAGQSLLSSGDVVKSFDIAGSYLCAPVSEAFTAIITRNNGDLVAVWERDGAIAFNGYNVSCVRNSQYNAITPNNASNYKVLVINGSSNLEFVTKSTTQVTETINLPVVSYYQKSDTGIPKTDLSTAVQTSLDKADTAIQSVKTFAGQTLSGAGEIVQSVASAGDNYVYLRFPGITAGTSALICAKEGMGFALISYSTQDGAKIYDLRNGLVKEFYFDTSGSNRDIYVRFNWGNAAEHKIIFLTGAPVTVEVTPGYSGNAGTIINLYNKPSTGIPASDLASAVQTSLGKADTAVQSVKTFAKRDITGSGDIANVTSLDRITFSQVADNSVVSVRFAPMSGGSSATVGFCSVLIRLTGALNETALITLNRIDSIGSDSSVMRAFDFTGGVADIGKTQDNKYIVNFRVPQPGTYEVDVNVLFLTSSKIAMGYAAQWTPYGSIQYHGEIYRMYSKPSTGIPASDLATEVQTSLGKADSAIQSVKTFAGISLAGTGEVVKSVTCNASTAPYLKIHGPAYRANTYLIRTIGGLALLNFLDETPYLYVLQGTWSELYATEGEVTVRYSWDSGNTTFSVLCISPDGGAAVNVSASASHTSTDYSSNITSLYSKPSTGIPASDLASGVIPSIKTFASRDIQGTGDVVWKQTFTSVTPTETLTLSFADGVSTPRGMNYFKFSALIYLPDPSFLGILTVSGSGDGGVLQVLKGKAPEFGLQNPELFGGPSNHIIKFDFSQYAGDSWSGDVYVTFLTGNYTGDVTYSWNGGAIDYEEHVIPIDNSVFWAYYNETTFAEIEEAWNAGKRVLATDDNGWIYIPQYFTGSSSDGIYFSTFAADEKIGYTIYVDENDNWQKYTLSVAPEIFWATYGTTSYDDIRAAWSSGKQVLVRFDDGYVMVPQYFGGTDEDQIYFSCLAADEERGYVAWIDYDDTWHYSTLSLSSEIFWATYGTTTKAEINTALSAGKVVMCTYDNCVYTLLILGNATYYYFYSPNAGGCRYLSLNKTTSAWSYTQTSFQLTNKKVTSWSSPTSDDNYPSEKLVKDSLDLKLNSADLLALTTAEIDTIWTGAL